MMEERLRRLKRVEVDAVKERGWDEEQRIITRLVELWEEIGRKKHLSRKVVGGINGVDWYDGIPERECGWLG